MSIFESSFPIELFGEKFQVGVINLQDPHQETFPVTHHILVIDRKPKHYDPIVDQIIVDQIIVDQIIEAVSPIPEKHLVSILWIGQGIIIKRDSLADSFSAMLQRESTEEELPELFERVHSCANLCSGLVDQTIVTFITDGFSTVSEFDRLKILSYLQSMTFCGTRVPAINTIGLEGPYDRFFLNKMTSLSELGKARNLAHCEFLEDSLLLMFQDATFFVENPVTIEANTGIDILYLGGTHFFNDFTSKLYVGKMEVKYLLNGSNYAFVVFPRSYNEKGFITVDLLRDEKETSVFPDTVLPVTTEELTSPELIRDFLYGYATRLYSSGDVEEAYYIIKEHLKNESLAKIMIEAKDEESLAKAQEALESIHFARMTDD